MKLPDTIRQMLFTAALAVTVSMTSQLRAAAVEDTGFPAPLPEWKTPAQLKVWRAETTAKTVAAEEAQAASAPKTYTATGFYTGKPYMAESGTYAFKYRDYNPQMGRWTTVDPSGFPDGANNRLYAAVPTSQLDNNGCKITADLSGYSGSVIDAARKWNALEGFASIGLPLTYTSMIHAENGGEWANDKALNSAINKSSIVDGGGAFDTGVDNWLHNNNVSGNGSLAVDMTGLHNNGSTPGHYELNEWDLAKSVHGVTFSVTGSVSGYGSSTGWQYDSTVSYSKEYTFKIHYDDGAAMSPFNAIGVALQKVGLIFPYPISGSFLDSWVE